MSVLPCFLCGNGLKKKTDKNNKPYFICDPCGIQLFIRRKPGIEKLHALLEDLETREIYSHTRSPEFLRIIAIFSEMSAVKAELAKVDEEIFLFANSEQTSAKKALQSRLNILLSELEDIAAQEDNGK